MDELSLITLAELESKETLRSKLLKFAEDYYHGGLDVQEIITDSLFDHLVQIYESRFGKYEVNGSAPIKRCVQLPVYMGSLDKIKSTNEHDLTKFLKRYKDYDSIIFSEKLDGVSGLRYIKNGEEKLLKKGDGQFGSDISFIIPYMSLPSISSDCHMVRGEFVLSKKKFQKHQESCTAERDECLRMCGKNETQSCKLHTNKKKLSNARAVVAGVLNSEKIDIKLIRDIDFVA